MRFGHEHKFILVSNWKCGCSTIADIFAPYSEFHWQTRERCKEIFGNDYRQLVHYPAVLIKRLFYSKGWDFDGYTKISSVRNPWARIVSLYFSLRVQIPFEQFVVQELPRYRSGQMSPVGRWDTFEMFHDEKGNRIVDHVVTLENLQQELEAIRVEKFPDIQLDYSIRTNRSEHEHYSRYYSDTTRDLVGGFFAYDIEQWGYRFEEAQEAGSLSSKPK